MTTKHEDKVTDLKAKPGNGLKAAPKTIVPVTDEEAVEVARAMDVSGAIDWDSQEHDAINTRNTAIARAKEFYTAFRACELVYSKHPIEAKDHSDEHGKRAHH